MFTIVAPKHGEQQPCPANVSTNVGAVSRVHALLVSFSSFQGGGPFAVVEMQYPGEPSVFVSIGGLPYGRILLSEDCDSVIVTPASDCVVWREAVRNFDAEANAR